MVALEHEEQQKHSQEQSKTTGRALARSGHPEHAHCLCRENSTTTIEQVGNQVNAMRVEPVQM